MPSYREITWLCDFKSTNAAYKLVDRLLAVGAVAKDAGGRLIPQKLFGDIPVLGVVEAGIMPGDIVVVERGIDPKDGDIVIAEVDGDWTIKYFRKRGKEVTLVPGNKKYKPIDPTTELNIAAVVKAQIRKY